ncbi:hypothetical protein B0H11DRAFT_1213715 [Mycena galericulata]|nr:hypothetical protein B0H11DRAFT_1213715 [Mycena galericulata]
MDALLVSDLQIVTYVKVAFLALLAYDTLLQIGQEYRYIWKSRWGVIKCLYLWTRYSTFIDTIIAVQERFDTHRDVANCNQVMDFTTFFAMFGIGMAEIILMIRTYAMYERSKKLLVFFFTLWFTVGVVDIWAAFRWTESYHIESAPSAISACYLGSSSGIGLVCYITLVVGETVIVLLTLRKGLQTFFRSKSTKSQPTELVTSFYRDGILFYLAILPISIVNVVTFFVAPPGLSRIADTPLRVTHTILCCHLVTHVRSIASEEVEKVTEAKSGLQFAKSTAGSQRQSIDSDV